MELTIDEISRLMSNLINNRADDETIKSLGFVAESIETSHRFVEALLASQSPSGSTDTNAVYSVVRILEALADKTKPISCMLMAYLHSIADMLHMHDVCDSIDLWSTDCDSPEFKPYLLVLASFQKDDDMRRHYERMAER